MPNEVKKFEGKEASWARDGEAKAGKRRITISGYFCNCTTKSCILLKT